MRRVLLTAMVAAVIIPFTARAQSKPDFSGTWTLDTAKSDPAPQGRGGGGGGAGSVTIKQTGTELVVTSEGRQGPQTMTYKLDGSRRCANREVDREMGRGEPGHRDHARIQRHVDHDEGSAPPRRRRQGDGRRKHDANAA